ncbi:hypothetical protein EVAR_37921_1 [Eumeta japonica]|uniref:Uncharacterized protein n=1 Tax=Eumeta variegata TaxID=151549 RepID=A0A4C1XE61_EUMVA|nr:hypothetical protein EVAR_37921_1 [Eumeta japonica]
MWNSSTKNGTDLRLGVRALPIIARLTVDENGAAALVSAHGTLRRKRHRLETWRTALLIIARLTVDDKTVQRRWISVHGGILRRRGGTDLRLGVLALLIIARLTVDE